MDRVVEATTPMQPRDRMAKKPKMGTQRPAKSAAKKSAAGKGLNPLEYRVDPMKSRTKALVALMSLPGIFYSMQSRGPWAIIRSKAGGGKSGKGGKIDMKKDEEVSIGKFGEMDEQGQLLDSELDLFTTASPAKAKAAKLPKVGGKGGKSAKLGKNGQLGKARIVDGQGKPILGGGASNAKGSLGAKAAKGSKMGKSNMGAKNAAKNPGGNDSMMDDLQIELPNKQRSSG